VTAHRPSHGILTAQAPPADRRARGYRRSGPPLGASLRDDSRVPPPNVTVSLPTVARHPGHVHLPRQTLLRGPVEPEQYTSFDYTQVLHDHEVLASIGTVGDALDNAPAESFVDSYKTELIADRVWRSRAQLELATVEYVGWFNHERLHEALGDIPPIEFEQRHALIQPVDGPLPGNGSVAVTSPRAPDGPRMPRFSTLGSIRAPPARSRPSTAPSSGALPLTPRRPRSSSQRWPLASPTGDSETHSPTTTTPTT
jgi:Integrase core domain